MALQWPKRYKAENVVSVTPTLDTNAYATGDRLGSIHTIAAVVRPDVSSGLGVATLKQIVIIDQAAQSADMDILFFNALPTVASADNAAIDISDAEMIAKFIGSVSVGAAYVALAANSVHTAIIDPGLKVYAASGTTIYALPVIRDSATYAANSLVFRYSFEIN